MAIASVPVLKGSVHKAEEKRHAQEKYVRDTLTSAIMEVRKAVAENRELPDASLLFDNI